MEKTNTIGFIGGGNMATAIINGVISSGLYQPSEIFVCDISADRRAYFTTQGLNAVDDNTQLVKKADMIVIAVKPNVAEDILDEIHTFVDSKKIIISIMTGWTTEKLSSCLPENAQILRVMPNTPALVGAGMSVLSADNNLDEEHMEKATAIFRALGEVEVIEEKYMDAVTGISGSGPAYVFMIIEALADAGVYEGLPRNIAIRLAAQTVMGSGKMVIATGTHPAVLKDAVCSPGGTTIEAIKTLEDHGLRAALINAAICCAQKARDLTAHATSHQKLVEQFIEDAEDDDE